jgi:hypothetical protein
MSSDIGAGSSVGSLAPRRWPACQPSYPRPVVIFFKKIEKSSCCEEIRSFA